jgi:hypothetical protein
MPCGAGASAPRCFTVFMKRTTKVSIKFGPRLMSALCVVLLLVPFGAGCARARARTRVPTAMDVPVPPPRLGEPQDVEALSPARVPEEPARPVSARPRPAVTRSDPPKAEGLKPEAPPADVPRVADEAPKPAPQPTTLQTTPPAAEGEVERTIRVTLARAASDLNRVDYRVLNADARAQYDTAKRFIQQAEESSRSRNLLFARNLAEKAAGLAAQLAAR